MLKQTTRFKYRNIFFEGKYFPFCLLGVVHLLLDEYLQKVSKTVCQKPHSKISKTDEINEIKSHAHVSHSSFIKKKM
jgi:hypothetical protein